MRLCSPLVVGFLVLSGCRELSIPPLQTGRVSGVAVYTDASGRVVPAAGAVVVISGSALRTVATAEGAFALEPITSATGELVVSVDFDGDGLVDLARAFDFQDWNIVPNQQTDLGQVALRASAAVTGVVLLSDAGVTGNAGTAVFVPGQALATVTSDTGVFVKAECPGHTQKPLGRAPSLPGWANRCMIQFGALTGACEAERALRRRCAARGAGRGG